ncbi:hypothetical protein, partial [Staphylococcus aureus]|uniref:hypothetical protein n=1 Tax=Staphylococcus aureus TaxID=1280 RepID=UPI001AD888B5
REFEEQDLSRSICAFSSLLLALRSSATVMMMTFAAFALLQRVSNLAFIALNRAGFAGGSNS